MNSASCKVDLSPHYPLRTLGPVPSHVSSVPSLPLGQIPRESDDSVPHSLSFQTSSHSHSPHLTPLSQARRILKHGPSENSSHSPNESPRIDHGSIRQLKQERLIKTSISQRDSSEDEYMPDIANSCMVGQFVAPFSSISTFTTNSPQSTSPVLSRRGSFSGLNQQFLALLASHSVADLGLETQKLVELSSSLSIEQGFERLLEANVLAAPVYTDTPGQLREYVGFLDIRDLVSALMFTHEGGTNIHQPWNEAFIRCQRPDSANSVPLSISYLAKKNPFKPVSKDSPLCVVAQLLAHQSHRVPVLDRSTNHCTAIISQSTIVSFLVKHRLALIHDWQQSISTLGLSSRSVYSVRSDKSAWAAFKLLESSGVSGIAVVDATGAIIGNTSARDLKLFVLNRGHFSLDICIMEYLSKIRQLSQIGYENHPACSVSETQSIGYCIDMIHATKYHRVFVVDSLKKPIGVVSVSDILRFCI